jgi:hypothetical protein
VQITQSSSAANSAPRTADALILVATLDGWSLNFPNPVCWNTSA